MKFEEAYQQIKKGKLLMSLPLIRYDKVQLSYLITGYKTDNPILVVGDAYSKVADVYDLNSVHWNVEEIKTMDFSTAISGLISTKYTKVVSLGSGTTMAFKYEIDKTWALPCNNTLLINDEPRFSIPYDDLISDEWIEVPNSYSDLPKDDSHAKLVPIRLSEHSERNLIETLLICGRDEMLIIGDVCRSTWGNSQMVSLDDFTKNSYDVFDSADIYERDWFASSAVGNTFFNLGYFLKKSTDYYFCINSRTATLPIEEDYTNPNIETKPPQDYYLKVIHVKDGRVEICGELSDSIESLNLDDILCYKWFISSTFDLLGITDKTKLRDHLRHCCNFIVEI